MSRIEYVGAQGEFVKGQLVVLDGKTYLVKDSKYQSFGAEHSKIVYTLEEIVQNSLHMYSMYAESYLISLAKGAGAQIEKISGSFQWGEGYEGNYSHNFGAVYQIKNFQKCKFNMEMALFVQEVDAAIAFLMMNNIDPSATGKAG